MATMRRLSQGCNTGSPVSQWDQLCPKCQIVVKEQGYETELKSGPSFQVQLVKLEMEKKLKLLQDRLHEKEESERSLQEQLIFLSAWDPVVMSPGYTDIVLQAGGHIVNAHRAVLVRCYQPVCQKSRQLSVITTLQILGSSNFTTHQPFPTYIEPSFWYPKALCRRMHLLLTELLNWRPSN